MNETRKIQHHKSNYNFLLRGSSGLLEAEPPETELQDSRQGSG